MIIEKVTGKRFYVTSVQGCPERTRILHLHLTQHPKSSSFTRISTPLSDRLSWRDALGCSSLITRRQPTLTRLRRTSSDHWRQFQTAHSSSVSLGQKLLPDQRRHPATPASIPYR